ncbi:putative iron reductase domain protein [Annulohypoxylon maeteangense]|uniref:putative iron reductase domain protein n=1 Tax=Annulohypoxylon maeteangense TaxID=1927788 RepID=UPI0020082A81|nr:putative iron reductase domain protein [Annulohypoxylon maeteangense]KAI0881669.1 putative iron reductase domain protein [Annulohypoxylon maeteangense]
MRSSNMIRQLGLALSFFFASSQAQTKPQAQDASNTPSNKTAGSVFVTPEQNLAFALNVPDDSTTDLYFSLMMTTSTSWGAIGLGSHMAGSLMLVVYPSQSRNSLTISPRIATGHTEPVYSPEIEIEVMGGTGHDNSTNTFIFNGRCTNCRSWSGGSGKVDVTSNIQSMMYATGEDLSYLATDARDGPLKMHYNYGTFTMDMVHATGPAGIPIIDSSMNSTLVGTSQRLSTEGKKDMVAMAHGVIMILVFVGLFPFGTFVLRFGNWVRWHGATQGFAFLLTFIASILGFVISKTYNRSKNFNTAHQVIGFFVFFFLFAQFALGFMHHRQFKKTKEPTKLAPIHRWLGRLILSLGGLNGVLGFKLAESEQYILVLTALTLAILPTLVIILVVKKCLERRWAKQKQETGYDMEPWRRPDVQQTYVVPVTTRPPMPPGQNASIPGMSSYMPHQAQSTRKNDLGPQQYVREYV